MARTPEEREKLWRREIARLDGNPKTAPLHESEKKNTKKQHPRLTAFREAHVRATVEELQQSIEAKNRDESLLRVISVKRDVNELIEMIRTLIFNYRNV
ncbi:MAG TPA: hypothetical protein VFD30_17095 [Terriglobia bacterium]|nr:hypothetical protein [Terriglobia bacterium]